jgi:carboxyl-terminal processing protease
VRNNPGGYIVQMTKVLDYLLPEGIIYQEEDYTGRSDQIKSDASCLELPIAVLVNKRSYSSAEFFAAVLQEYDWATIVGQHTTGKGYYQNTIALPDGSAVNLSIGKYCTPNGVNLMEVGGITPDVESLVDDETDAYIYYDLISAEDDPQIQAAVQSLNKTAD